MYYDLPNMKAITFTNPHRKKHFDFFNGMNHPHLNITANVDVTNLISFLKSNGLPITPSIVYIISKTANAIPQFRWRIRNGKVFEHEVVHPSFTVSTEESDVFSFCTVEFNDDPKTFLASAVDQINAMQTAPSFEDEEGRDDYLFLSAIPWVSFTSMQHAMHYHPSDSVPRITWGKFFKQNGKTLMPLSLQAHHALVDGQHMGSYFMDLEEMAFSPERYL